MTPHPDELRLWEAQLGRMRSMLFRYYELFFRFIHASVAGLGLLFVASFWQPAFAAALLLPFAILFVGFHSAYLFSYVLFARRYALTLERRINAAIGREALQAHRLEAAYFGAVGDPKLVAASLRDPLTMLAADTWHFSIAGGGLFVVSAVRAAGVADLMGGAWASLYVPVLVGWAALNGLYLAWHFGLRRDLRRLDAILEEPFE